MPALSLSEAVDEVVCFRFTRDRRRYLAHVLPYREQRAGYPRFSRDSFRSHGTQPVSTSELPDLSRNHATASRP